MKRTKLKKLLKAIDKKVKVSEANLKENKVSADLTSKTAGASWSAAGEREYTAGQLEINQKVFDQIIKLQREIAKQVESEIPEKVETPCYVVIRSNKGTNNIFIVKNVTSINGFNLVSSESPMGKALIGRKVGDTLETGIGADVELLEIG